MKRLIVIGLMLILSGCATAKVVDEPTDEIILEGMGKEIEWRRVTHRFGGDIYWAYLGQVKRKYHVFDYKMEMTPAGVRNRLNVIDPSILVNFPTGKWIEGKLHYRCDGFYRFCLVVIRDMNEEVLERDDGCTKWFRLIHNPVIDKIWKDAGICGW